MKLTKGKKLTILIILIIIFNSIFIVVGFNTFKNSGDDKVVTNQNIVEKVERSISGKGTETDKKDALSTVQELLNASNNYSGELSVQERLSQIDKSDYSVADIDRMRGLIRFSGDFENDKDIENTTFQSLITLASYLSVNNNDIVPLSDTMYNYVYLDSELGIAFVPMNVFTNSSTLFSLEMVYVDGGWKLLPYSLLDAVRLTSSISVD